MDEDGFTPNILNIAGQDDQANLSEVWESYKTNRLTITTKQRIEKTKSVHTKKRKDIKKEISLNIGVDCQGKVIKRVLCDENFEVMGLVKIIYMYSTYDVVAIPWDLFKETTGQKREQILNFFAITLPDLVVFFGETSVSFILKIGFGDFFSF